LFFYYIILRLKTAFPIDSDIEQKEEDLLVSAFVGATVTGANAVGIEAQPG
jgi:hypothetical protein